MTTHNPTYLAASIQGAIDDFRRDAGPSNVNEPLINLACDLLELAHANQGYTEADALDTARREARALGHAEQSIKDTLKSAQRRTAGKARIIPEPKHSPRQTRAPSAPADHPRASKIPPKSYTDLADYAAAHGAPLAAYTAAGWSDTILHGRRAVRFTTEGGPRWRYIDGGEGGKYWHPAGSHTDEHKRWYLLASARPLIDQTGYIVLVNGEASAVAAQHYGIPAVCEAGGGEKTTPQHLLDQIINAFPPERFTVLIPADSDARGRKAAPGKAEQYRKAGYTARALDLNLAENHDLADFCQLHQADSLAELLTCRELIAAAPAAPETRSHHERLIKIHWGAEIDQITPPRQLIKGYLTTASVALFIGPSESGKSTISVDVACKVAQHYPVIYVAGEDGGNVKTQIRAWELTNQRERGRLGLMDAPLLLADDAHVDAFIATALPAAPQLVIIDTLSSCIPGLDENASEMTSVTFNLNRIADTLGAAVLVLHHPLKYDGETFRGHSSLLNNTHTMWVVSRDDGDDVVTLKVTRHKGSRAAPATLKIMRRETDIYDADEGYLSSPVAIPAALVLRSPDHLSIRQKAILQYLADLAADGGATVGDICRTIAAEFKTSEGRIRRDVADLVSRKLMSAAEKQREPRQITEKGQAAIKSDLVRSGDQVIPSDPFVINPHLRAATDQIANQIAPDRPVFAHQHAEHAEPDRTRSQPDRGTSDQVPISTAEPDHLITSFRSDQVIWSGDGQGGCSDPNPGPPCSASSLDLVNRDHVLHELARPDGVPERYLERIRDQATRRYVAAEIAHLALARTGVSDEADEPAEPHRAGLAYPC